MGSKEVSSERSSSNYLSDLMKEGRMRCDEEGSSGKVTRMDGRLRIQDKVAADKRKENKILGIVTIDRDSEEILKDERSSVLEEGSQMGTKSDKEDEVDKQQQRPTSALGAVVKNDVKEDDDAAS